MFNFGDFRRLRFFSVRDFIRKYCPNPNFFPVMVRCPVNMLTYEANFQFFYFVVLNSILIWVLRRFELNVFLTF